jgi:hypothetical protein
MYIIFLVTSLIMADSKSNSGPRWSKYHEYIYPARSSIESDISNHHIRRTGSTIVRAPVHRSRSVDRAIDGLKTCYCLDDCNCDKSFPNISRSLMFRPFRTIDIQNDDILNRCATSKMSADNYKIEVVKKSNSDIELSKFSSIRPQPVSASTFRKNGHAYYRLRHGDGYAIKMFNETNQHVNALLKIDSDTMGKWRIRPYSSIIIERPTHNPRKFTFVKEFSSEALEGGVRQGKNSGANGLVEVTFIPMIDKRPARHLNYDDQDSSREFSLGSKPISFTNNPMTNSRDLEAHYSMDSNTESNSMSRQSQSNKVQYESGATILGEDSEQKFGKASIEFIEDLEGKIIKRLRIVVDNRSQFASIRDRDDGYDDREFDDPVPPKYNYMN